MQFQACLPSRFICNDNVLGKYQGFSSVSGVGSHITSKMLGTPLESRLRPPGL